MKLLLTSQGITNPSLRSALVELLGKPIEESRAIFVSTGMHPFRGGGDGMVRALRGDLAPHLTGLGWGSLGLLEITALETVKRENWVHDLTTTDALLVWGGHVAYLHYWMKRSGVADFLASRENLVYVGVSAGSIVTTPHNCDAESNLEELPENSPARDGASGGLALVPFTMWVHVGNPHPIFADHTLENVERWSRTVPAPTYSLDDNSGVVVEGHDVRVVSEGDWRLFVPPVEGI